MTATPDPYYRLGLEQESPGDFLHYRHEWLADPLATPREARSGMGRCSPHRRHLLQ